MNEQEFRAYLKKAMEEIHKTSRAFFKENPGFDGENGYLSAYFYNDAWCIWNSGKADKSFKQIEIKGGNYECI